MSVYDDTYSFETEGVLDQCDAGEDPMGAEEYTLRLSQVSDETPSVFAYVRLAGLGLGDIRGLTFGKRYRLTLTEAE